MRGDKKAPEDAFMHFAAVTSPPKFSPPHIAGWSHNGAGFDGKHASLSHSAAALLPAVNLNTAGQAELTTLQGLTPARAQLLIAYREACGGFANVEQVIQIPGLGAAMMRRNLPRLHCGHVTSALQGFSQGGEALWEGRASLDHFKTMPQKVLINILGRCSLLEQCLILQASTGFLRASESCQGDFLYRNVEVDSRVPHAAAARVIRNAEAIER